jgi:nucleoside-diphosphate-sugar epimerase
LNLRSPAVLVTGGSGFLGRAIVEHLHQLGHPTRTLQRRRTGNPDVGMLEGDVRDPASVASALEGVEVVVHAAGLAHVFSDPHNAPFLDINERGTEVVARSSAAAGVRHLILISSVAVYGEGSHARDEDSPCRPVGPYAVSKAAAEARAIEAAQRSGMRLTILRLATLYGPGDRGNVQRLLELLARGRFLWVGNGANRKTLLHVDDAARGCVLPLTTDGTAVEIYNLGAPPVPLRTVVDGLAGALGRPAPRWHVPAGVAVVGARSLRMLLPTRGRAAHDGLMKWLKDDVYSANRFARRFEFHAGVPLQDGLASQVAWWRSFADSRGVC